MKKYFENRLQAIDWIASRANDEGQFEVLREMLTFNFIYTGTFFIDLKDRQKEVELLKKQ